MQVSIPPRASRGGRSRDYRHTFLCPSPKESRSALRRRLAQRPLRRRPFGAPFHEFCDPDPRKRSAEHVARGPGGDRRRVRWHDRAHDVSLLPRLRGRGLARSRAGRQGRADPHLCGAHVARFGDRSGTPATRRPRGLDRAPAPARGGLRGAGAGGRNLDQCRHAEPEAGPGAGHLRRHFPAWQRRQSAAAEPRGARGLRAVLPRLYPGVDCAGPDHPGAGHRTAGAGAATARAAGTMASISDWRRGGAGVRSLRCRLLGAAPPTRRGWASRTRGCRSSWRRRSAGR